MRILILAPRSNFPEPTPGWLRIPQLALAVLEALTPEGHEVRVVEEEFEPLPLDEHWDLIGITTMTATAQRAYELARRFRERGGKVVLGGVHVSMLPEEALEHADAVVVGEAEGVWERVVEDARRGELRRIYRNMRPPIEHTPVVKWPRPRKIFGINTSVTPVMTTRGCPNDCEFCCVHQLYGHRVRYMPIERVVEQIRSTHTDQIMFLDDNLGGNRRYAMRLFAALRPLRIQFLAQVSVRFVLDEPLFAAARRAGLAGIFVGVESVQPEAMRALRKSTSLDDLVRAIRRCNRAGVAFHASLIFGLDEQGPSVFDHTLDFLMTHNVPSASANVLTPYPGTALYDRLLREGRIVHTNWAYYDHTTPVFRPARMSPRQLADNYIRFRRGLFSLRSIAKRLPAQLHVRPMIYLGMNLAYRRTTRLLAEHHRRYFAWLADYTRRKSLVPDASG